MRQRLLALYETSHAGRYPRLAAVFRIVRNLVVLSLPHKFVISTEVQRSGETCISSVLR